VRFKEHGKLYFFAPGELAIPDDTSVVVEVSKGLELGLCAYGNHYVPDDKIVPPLRPVVRIATENDLQIAAANKAREKDAFEICQRKIADHGLDMKLVDVECNFEGSKILFFFTSDGRVDFRELVKDLASVFRTRIELRQIGVRDEAKMLGGLGICGRPFCCSQFLDEFCPVSTKMAKTQSMSLNPTKISGSCGRLMCCLRYEQEAYEELVKNAPKNGAFVETVGGYGNVTQVNLLRQQVKVKLDGAGDPTVKTYGFDEIAVVPGGRPKPGEALPSLLGDIVPKAKKEEEPEDPWKDLYIPTPPRVRPVEEPAGETVAQPKRKSGRSRSGRKNRPRRSEEPVQSREKSVQPQRRSRSEAESVAKQERSRGQGKKTVQPRKQTQSQQPARESEGGQAASGQHRPRRRYNRSRGKGQPSGNKPPEQ